MKIDKNTKLFFSISEKPGNFGATLYNAAFEHLGINAIYKPIKFDAQFSDSFRNFFKTLISMGVSGVSVSMPFKKEVFHATGSSNGVPAEVGNVNTVIFNDNKKIKVYNTDSLGFSVACQEILDKSKQAVIYGTGAVSDSISYILAKKNIPYVQLSKEYAEQLHKFKGDFLINATPVGMDGIEDNVFTKDIIAKYDYVFDVVVKKDTQLIQRAKWQRKTCVSGVEMSLHQLCAQFKIYTGQDAPIELFRKLLKENGYV